MTIPPILHQTWKSKTDLPDNFRFWRQSFIDLNPQLEPRLYDDADNRALLARTFPTLLPLYDAYPKEIFRVDFIRPVYLYTEGGYYADLDFQCLQPLSRLDQGGQIIVGAMGTNLKDRHSIPNAFMASDPGEGFWIGYLAWCDKIWREFENAPELKLLPEYLVGPVVLHAAAMQYTNNHAGFVKLVGEFVDRRGLDVDPEKLRFGKMAIMLDPILYPINWQDETHRDLFGDVRSDNVLYSVEEARDMFPRSVAVTYWISSWRPKPASARRPKISRRPEQ
jgi:hypothetical protein